MIEGSLPRRYAKALAGLAIEDGRLEEYGKSIHSIAEVFRRDPKSLNVLANKVIPRRERKSAAEEICKKIKLQETIKNFLLFLIDRERIGILPQIQEAYGAYQDECQGIIRAIVTATQKMDTKQAKKIEEILGKMTSKKVVAAIKQDPSILGGLILQMDSCVYDGSIRSALSRVRQQMIQG